MKLPEFIQALQLRLQKELPGWKAQQQMIPGSRDRKIPDSDVLDDARKAAVGIVFYQKQKSKEAQAEWYVLIIKRTSYPGVHSGQMAFPGGRVEEEDIDLVATALRETEEEIGWSRTDMQVLGQLSPVYIRPSHSLVQPIVLYQADYSPLVAQEKEVELIVEAPVSLLQDPEIRKKRTVHFYEGQKGMVPSYGVFEHVVWGATAVMLSELLVVLEEAQRNLS